MNCTFFLCIFSLVFWTIRQIFHITKLRGKTHPAQERVWRWNSILGMEGEICIVVRVWMWIAYSLQQSGPRQNVLVFKSPSHRFGHVQIGLLDGRNTQQSCKRRLWGPLPRFSRQFKLQNLTVLKGMLILLHSYLWVGRNRNQLLVLPFHLYNLSTVGSTGCTLEQVLVESIAT